ncbi:MAG: hypothetical protein J7496_11855 [Novosphingobium sp.]|nr:hypothetical protein [Novosphingobium sp.]
MTVTIAAAAMLATGATPAFAKLTRSVDSLPTRAQASIAARSTGGFASPRASRPIVTGSVVTTPSITPTVVSPTLVSPTSVSPTAASLTASSLTTQRVPRVRGNRLGSLLSTIFKALPPSLQQVIANALANAGNTNTCDLLGIPGCQIGDSTG